MDTAVVTLRLPSESKALLDKLAAATQRSKSYLCSEAIAQYLEREAWQIGEIQAALQEADAGDFAADAEVAALARKYAG